MTKSDSGTRTLHAPPSEKAAPPATLDEKLIPVREILGPHQEVILLHSGQRYRLRLTSNDRLILTK